MAKIKRERVEMRIPDVILRKVEEYQQQNGISSRTAAFLELVRKGLEADRKERQK